MGASSCSCCSATRTQRPEPIAHYSFPDGHKPREGQARASLQVKDGGFALSNFIASNPGKIDDHYVFEKKVGEGGFGTVRRATDKSTNAWRAVKSVSKKNEAADKLQEEIEVMRCLDHPHIVRLVESFQDHRCVYMVLELCEGGELFDAICDAGSFKESTAASCVRQMLLAVNYLHQNLVIHRDLKPQNWLLSTREGIGDSPLKLIDFGLSKRLMEGTSAKTKVGTPSYVAPEVLAGCYGYKADVWSLGIIAYAMLSGELPFGAQKTQELLRQIKVAKVEVDHKAMRYVSDIAKDMVLATLTKNPDNRPTAAQALQHKWILSPPEDANLSDIDLNSLKSFARVNQFKKAAFTAVAMQLSDQRIEKLKSAFMSMDKNQDGTISYQELRAGLQQTGLNVPKDLQKLLEQTDTDGSGVIDYTEFLAATVDKKLCRQEHVLWAAFKKFDADNSGTIEFQELRKVLADPTVEEVVSGGAADIDKIFREVDTNKDGVIDFDEFLEMVRAQEAAD